MSLATHTYQPDDVDSICGVEELLTHARSDGSTLSLRSSNGEEKPLPACIIEALSHLVTALASGKSVTLTPQQQRLTTQESADLLGISRPTLIRLIEAGKLHAERAGNRRRLLLSDVLAYLESRRKLQYELLEATSITNLDDQEPKKIIEKIRTARQNISSHRKP